MSCLPSVFCQNGTGVPAVLAHLVRSGGALPLFRFPILLEGEQIDFPKETQAKHLSQGLPLGRDSFGYPGGAGCGFAEKARLCVRRPWRGKTNTMLGLCYNLWKEYRIPFLVLEPAKKEYRAWPRPTLRFGGVLPVGGL